MLQRLLTRERPRPDVRARSQIGLFVAASTEILIQRNAAVGDIVQAANILMGRSGDFCLAYIVFRSATLILLAAALTCGCRRASVADEGAAARATAFPKAEMQAADRAYRANPEKMSPAATGTPMREAPAGNTPPSPASLPQR
jgi:hypothetical protein